METFEPWGSDPTGKDMWVRVRADMDRHWSTHKLDDTRYDHDRDGVVLVWKQRPGRDVEATCLPPT